MKKVAIVVPLRNRSSLTEAEVLSLRHLDHFLGEFDRYFIGPASLQFEHGSTPVVRFDDKYFGDQHAHARLCLSSALYSAFSEYEFILFAHLDSLVLRPGLEDWCEAGFDFIGAPWVMGPDLPWLKEEAVGNGGFSLRRVQAFLGFLNSTVPCRPLRETVASARSYYRKARRMAGHYSGRTNRIGNHISRFLRRGGNEDMFISMFATHYCPDFRIAPVETALGFSFEANPRICYRRNGNRIPFGCHAWQRYDQSFWDPYLLTKGNRPREFF